jgi:hypothetical protein
MEDNIEVGVEPTNTNISEEVKVDVAEKRKATIVHLKNEIEKLKNKESNIYFFTIDCKGVNSGSIQNIYVIAKMLQDEGYNVSMLYQNGENDPFVGVEDFLGDKYNTIVHHDLQKDKVTVNPSDILIIPELFSNIMRASKTMPCKKIVLSQNYDFITETLPVGQDFGQLGIIDCITTTQKQKQLLLDIMPYLKVDVIEPSIAPYFYPKESGIKKLQIAILTQDRSAVNKIAKLFYMKYPILKFVTFKHLTNLNQELYADELRNSIASVVVDLDTYFSYQTIESVRCGNITIAVMPHEQVEWQKDENGQFTNSVIWIPNLNEVANVLASAITNWMDDTVPYTLYDNMKNLDSKFLREQQKNQVIEVFGKHIERRKYELEETIKLFEKNVEKEEG